MTAVLTPTRHQVMLHGMSWATYQGLIRDLESEPGKRLTYAHGTLEIMVPLPPHESYESRLGRLVEVTTEETNTEIASLLIDCHCIILRGCYVKRCSLTNSYTL